MVLSVLVVDPLDHMADWELRLLSLPSITGECRTAYY